MPRRVCKRKIELGRALADVGLYGYRDDREVVYLQYSARAAKGTFGLLAVMDIILIMGD
jgi:hypothetical protein